MSFTEGPDPSALATRLQLLLPGTAVEARSAGGLLRRRVRSAAAQIDSIAVLDIWFDDHQGRLTVRVPDHEHLLVANVAEMAATTIDVRRAFGRAATHISELSFDRAESGFKGSRSRLAGTAHTGLGHTHINASLVFPGRPPGQGRSALSAIAAHECWHQIEHAFEMQRYTESIAFRRALGEHYGVETLEKVMTGNRPDAPPAQRLALDRLRAEVSDYATTNGREATAEMMAFWWCAIPPVRPISALFGDLMVRHFAVIRP